MESLNNAMRFLLIGSEMLLRFILMVLSLPLLVFKFAPEKIRGAPKVDYDKYEENRSNEIEEILSNPNGDLKQITKYSNRYNEIKTILTEKYERWEYLSLLADEVPRRR